MKKLPILFLLLSACNSRGEGDGLGIMIYAFALGCVFIVIWISGRVIDFFSDSKEKNYEIKPNINRNKETEYSKRNRKKLLEELAEDKKNGDSLEDSHDLKNNDKNADTEYARINREKFMKELEDDKRKGDKYSKERD